MLLNKNTMQKRKPIIHRVQHKNLPREVRHIKGLAGYQKKDDIWLVKGKSDDLDYHHEVYHHKKNHPAKPRNPRKTIRQELEATMYAQEKTGRHKRINLELKGMSNDLGEVYNLPPSKVIRIVASEVRKKDIPKSFKRNFNIIAKQAYQGRKLPKDVRIKL